MVASRLEFRILGPLVVRVDGMLGPGWRTEAAGAAGAPPARCQPCRLAGAADRRALLRAELELGRPRAPKPGFAAAEGAQCAGRRRAAPGCPSARLPVARRARRARSRALRAARRRGSGVERGRRSHRRGGLVAGGRAPVGGAAARRSRVRAVREHRDRAPRGASSGGGRGADRCRARARSPVDARLGARSARRRASVPGALSRAADARALPMRPASGGTRGLPADAKALERRARPRAERRAAGARAGDPRPGPRVDRLHGRTREAGTAGRLPVQGPRSVRGGGRGILLRARAAHRGAGSATRRGAVARHHGPIRERQVVTHARGVATGTRSLAAAAPPPRRKVAGRARAHRRTGGAGRSARRRRRPVRGVVRAVGRRS